MSEKDNPGDQKDSDLNNDTRRRFLGKVGVGALGATGFGFTGTASASNSEEGSKTEVDPLSKKEKSKALKQAKKNKGYKKIVEYYGEEFDLDVQSPEVVGIKKPDNQGNKEYSLVRFPVEPEDDSKSLVELRQESAPDNKTVENVQADIVVLLNRNGSDPQAKGAIIDSWNDGTYSATTIQFEEGSVQVQRGSFDPSAETAQEAFSTESGDVTTAACGCPTKCDLCKELVDFICKEGCGLGAIGICAAVGAATGVWGGITCSTMAAYICKDINLSYDCDRSSRNLCRYYGYC